MLGMMLSPPKMPKMPDPNQPQPSPATMELLSALSPIVKAKDEFTFDFKLLGTDHATAFQKAGKVKTSSYGEDVLSQPIKVTSDGSFEGSKSVAGKRSRINTKSKTWHLIANGDRSSGIFRDQVGSEQDLITLKSVCLECIGIDLPGPAKCRKRFQGFASVKLALRLVHCRRYAPGAWLRNAKYRLADPYLFPIVFRKRLGPRYHDVRSKPVHGNAVFWIRDPRVQGIQ
jgi:hypothetical protein